VNAPTPAGIEFLYGPDDIPPAPRLLAYGFQWVLVAIGPITLFVPVAPGSLAPEDLAVLQQAFDRVIDLRAIDVIA